VQEGVLLPPGIQGLPTVSAGLSARFVVTQDPNSLPERIQLNRLHCDPIA
jgi:hypothetical protein